ncbi:MAG TPA: GTPase Era [Treponemataceae bacterium]|jgi:GTP-binding protein Era|nr:GTPase Era [Treponemataceae bacterium]HOS34200.1 GTPase Era [Treponemataceae bacterium]HOU37881.1 GTPase Era [Treponemataceae bacterium]HPA09651.1 GTPase Era [Treponemataceae bacterium]HPL90698.1 GTPase Era [Treponemataceae bacterium]
MEHTKKSGIVAIIGRPSAGKSTLLNSLAGAKVSIVSPVPQTTRNAIRGIVNRPKGQLVFIDTPGYHDSDKKLNLLLKGIAKDRLPEADCILYLIDASREAGPEEASIIQLLAKSADKLVIGINKVDRQDARPDMVRLFLEKELPGVSHDRIVELSAGTGKNTGVLLDAVYSVVPEGEAMYPEEYYTDQDVDFRIAEIIREKAILNTRQEIPHALYVEIADMEMKRNGKELWVRAFIVVERETQKAMVIGKGASMIKKIRTEAKDEMKKIFDYYIRLDLQVRVHKNWRQKDPVLGRLMKR